MPSLKPEHIAEKVLELASHYSKITSGKIIEIQVLPIPQFNDKNKGQTSGNPGWLIALFAGLLASFCRNYSFPF